MSNTCLTYYRNAELPNFSERPDLSEGLYKCLGYDSILNQELTLPQWKLKLNEGVCETTFNEYIYNDGQGTFLFNQQRFLKIQNGMKYAFFKFYVPSNGFQMVNPNQIGYNSIQDSLLNLCGSQFLGGICNTVQTEMCTSCNREDIIKFLPITKFCGCFVPPDQLSINNGVSPECDPLCSQGKSIKKANRGIITQCDQSVCIINNISISSVKSSVDKVSFNQICPQCKNGCRCIIDSSILDIDKIIGITDEITFNQYCGPNSVCLIVDNKTGESKQTPCSTSLNKVKFNTYKFSISIIIWIIVILIIVVFILVCITRIYELKNN